MSLYRHQLPQLGNQLFITDGSLETTLVFHAGTGRPVFAAHDGLRTPAGCDHLEARLDGNEHWLRRIRGIRASASRMSRAELDESETLDDGDPVEFGQQCYALHRRLPHRTVMSGCCGTDHRHIEQICCQAERTK
jgi:methionine synthase I (cobalamin-dependent)